MNHSYTAIFIRRYVVRFGYNRNVLSLYINIFTISQKLSII